MPEEGGPAPERRNARGRGTFAERLEYLFQTVRPGGQPLTMDEVEARITGQGGERVSSAYLSALRRGVRDNPSLRTIEALARCFGVPPSYFLDDATAEEVRSQLEMLLQMRDSGVTNLKFRGSNLTPETRSEIVKVLQELAAEQRDAVTRVVQAIEREGAASAEEPLRGGPEQDPPVGIGGPR
ncbi:MAG TPA: helix-turn-helix transcriptional regulator [Acidimicrobiales bacterium]|nr:helix-turn-helix transcriptional regulator [Acidimicrobiales bacterium]